LQFRAKLFEYGRRFGELHQGVQQPLGDLKRVVGVLCLLDEFPRVYGLFDGFVDRRRVDLDQSAQARVLLRVGRRELREGLPGRGQQLVT
jgi:hypothetical protein